MKTLFLTFAMVAIHSVALAADASLATKKEEDFIRNLQILEVAKTDKKDAVRGGIWTLRSGHFVFGMPRLIDDRHNYIPEGYSTEQPGISVVVREGFVVAHFDQMKSPLWVAQRWTKYDYKRMKNTRTLGRPWREDLDLPKYARGGTSYDGLDTKLFRGQMAHHKKNKAWGADVSNWGVKMSNSAPQHISINQGMSWRKLEDEAREIVKRRTSRIGAIWVYSGTIFRDKHNPANESPDADFNNVVRLKNTGFAVPDATYKVVGWFNESKEFQARAYIFEQQHEPRTVSGEQRPKFHLPDQQSGPEKFLVKIDDLENRIGVDFFPMLQDDSERLIEGAENTNLWGAE